MLKILTYLFIFFISLISLYSFGVIMTDYTDPKDIKAVAHVKSLNITPNTPYYHQTPIPNEFERYKGFPYTAPLSAEKAENEWGDDLYRGAVTFEVGDNYQYKIITERPRKSFFIVLPKERFKELDNGVHFFTMDLEGQLHPLSGAEEALQQSNYIRVEKEMGKVISIEKRPLVQNITTYYEYYDNGNLKHTKSEEKDEFGNISSTITADYGKDGEMYSIIGKNKEGNVIKIIKIFNENGIFGTTEIFNDQGVKTNHIITMIDGEVTNQHLNEKGDITLVTQMDPPPIRSLSFEEQEPYKLIPIDPTKPVKEYLSY